MLSLRFEKRFCINFSELLTVNGMMRRKVTTTGKGHGAEAEHQAGGTASKRGSIHGIPDDVAEEIVQWLPLCNVVRVTRVSKFWKRIVEERPHLIERFYIDIRWTKSELEQKVKELGLSSLLDPTRVVMDATMSNVQEVGDGFLSDCSSLVEVDLSPLCNV